MDGLTGQTRKEYVWLDGMPLAVLEAASGQTYYVHADHLNTPRMLTDATGQVVWRAAYAPFGAAAVVSAAGVEFNLRFPGQYFDAETGLHYNWNRYYDPQTGRYTTSDPIGLEGGLNTYAYVGGNPLRYSDPTGLLQAPAPGTRLFQTLVNAGGMSQADGPILPLGDIAAAAYLAGYLGAAAYDSLTDGSPTGSDNVIPFPTLGGDTSDIPAQDGGSCTKDDPDGPHSCELWYGKLMMELMQLHSRHTQAPMNDIQLAQAKRGWDKEADEYNGRCVRRGFPPIRFRFRNVGR